MWRRVQQRPLLLLTFKYNPFPRAQKRIETRWHRCTATASLKQHTQLQSSSFFQEEKTTWGGEGILTGGLVSGACGDPDPMVQPLPVLLVLPPEDFPPLSLPPHLPPAAFEPPIPPGVCCTESGLCSMLFSSTNFNSPYLPVNSKGGGTVHNNNNKKQQIQWHRSLATGTGVRRIRSLRGQKQTEYPMQPCQHLRFSTLGNVCAWLHNST